MACYVSHVRFPTQKSGHLKCNIRVECQTGWQAARLLINNDNNPCGKVAAPVKIPAASGKTLSFFTL